MNTGTTLLWLAALIGLLFGALSQATRFCTMGAVADIVNMGAWNRMRMWGLAIGVAILGTTALQLAGWLDVHQTIYTGQRLLWLSHLVGGVCFGVGMTLASGCGVRTLTRLGAGNLKSLIVLIVMAISAYMTLRGLFGMLRVGWLDAVAIELDHHQDLPSLTGLPLAPLGVLCGTACCLPALLRREARTLEVWAGGIGCGALVVAAWYVSGHLGYVAEDPDTLMEAFLATNSGRAESLSFVAPAAFGLELLLLWSDTSKHVSFGIAAALGVLAGSLLHATLSRNLRVESFSTAEDLGRHLLGAVLMGFGGVTALGCTVGQGISGVSTLALGSFITLAGILLGATASLKYQYWRLMRDL